MEVMVALAVASIALLALARLVVNAAVKVEAQIEREHQVDRASEFFARAMVWTKTDLEQRLGHRAQGEWILKIERVSETLFYVVLLDTTTRHNPILQTMLYRPSAK